MKICGAILLVLICLSCRINHDKNLVPKNISITVYPYEKEGKMLASAMPEIKPYSEFQTHKRRFEYLIMNVPAIHLPAAFDQRTSIGSLYPDTTEIKRRYLDSYANDEKLNTYLKQTFKAIREPDLKNKPVFTKAEMMEVASKFFYCDKVLEDTAIQAHVCIGLNGIKEATWEKDYTLLAAFCFEAIFDDLDKDTSQVWDLFGVEKQIACEKYRPGLVSLDLYLEQVKLDVFDRMKKSAILSYKLMEYYYANKSNLSFIIDRPLMGED